MTSKAFESLPCELSASEKAAKSDELARAVRRKEELTLEKSLTAQRLGKDIKECDRKVADLAEEIRTGIEYRDVPVLEEVRGTRMETIRTDTYETVSYRPLEEHERQRGLFEERRAERGTTPTGQGRSKPVKVLPADDADVPDNDFDKH
jgi:hypothetical protein